MTVEFKQDDRCYLAVEVPEGAKNFTIIQSHSYFNTPRVEHSQGGFDLPKDKGETDKDYSIIGLSSKLTEEQAKEMVEEHVVIGSVLPNKYYNNYGEYECRDFRDLIDNSFLSATESIKSRLTSLKLSDNVLIIQKL